MHRTRALLTALAVGAALLLAAAPPVAATETAQVSVIAHRGASGYMVENTLPSALLAISQDADQLEVDVVPTKDGALIVRNDNELSGTTDIAAHPEFAALRTTKTVDGVQVTGWFSEDLTLAQVNTLRAVERLPDLRPANTQYNGLFPVPTVLQLVQAARFGVSVYIELKHPGYFRSIGLPVEERLVTLLRSQGLTDPKYGVVLQSFEPSSLQRLNQSLSLPLVQGLDVAGRPYDFTAAGDTRTYADLKTPAGLAWIGTYADAVGVNAALVVPRDSTNHLTAPTTLIADSHAAGLEVHAWTFRAENFFLPADFRSGTDPAAHGDLTGYLRLYYGLGVDAVFVEFPDIAVAARG